MATAHRSRWTRFVASRWIPPLAAMLVACSGGSSGPGPATPGTAPTIASLHLWSDRAALNDGGGAVSASFDFVVTDPDADVARAVVTLLDAAGAQAGQNSQPVTNPPGETAGGINGVVAISTATLATYTVQVQVFDARGSASNVLSAPFAVVQGNPAPAIASLSPDRASAGSAGFTLTVTGTGFVDSSVVTWSDFSLPTTYVDATTLRAQVDGYLLFFGGSAQVAVVNLPPGGGTSASKTFAIEPSPVPTLTTISPDRAPAGTPGLTLTVTGTEFVESSVVTWSGYSLPTTYVDGTTLQAQVDSYRLSYSGSAQVAVVNPGGTTSASKTFAIEPPPPSPVPTLTSISPTSVDAGGPAVTLTVKGTGFVGTSRVVWNGSHLSTTCVDANTLTATLQPYDIQTPRSVTVAVATPQPGGGTSSSLTFKVTTPEQPGVTIVPLKANDLAWDPYQRKNSTSPSPACRT